MDSSSFQINNDDVICGELYGGSELSIRLYRSIDYQLIKIVLSGVGCLFVSSFISSLFNLCSVIQRIYYICFSLLQSYNLFEIGKWNWNAECRFILLSRLYWLKWLYQIEVALWMQPFRMNCLKMLISSSAKYHSRQ